MSIQDNSRYHQVHARSLADPEGFWREAINPLASGNRLPGLVVRAH